MRHTLETNEEILNDYAWSEDQDDHDIRSNSNGIHLCVDERITQKIRLAIAADRGRQLARLAQA
jgi:hypothetical protein